jgi:hypothetical protein
MKLHTQLAHQTAVVGTLFLSCCGLAQTSKEDAIRLLDKSEHHLRLGVVITADILQEKNEYPERLERTYISGDNIRVDTILGYEAGKPLMDPTITIGLFTPKHKQTGQVLLEGTFKDADAVFAKLINRPMPEIRHLSTISSLSDATPQVLGFTGSTWLSARLKSSPDASMKTSDGKETLKWGAGYPFTTEVTYLKGGRLIDSYRYQPNKGNTAFESFQVQMDHSSPKGTPVYNFDSKSKYGDVHYKLKIVRVDYGPVADSVFSLGG